MILSTASIQRPVLATVISFLLVVTGIAAVQQLPVREYPDIDPPVVSVTTLYPGASAEVVDREVTEVIEEQVSGIQGIKRITSTSRDVVSEISIEFQLAEDLDASAAEVRDRLGRARRNLPDEVEEPVVSKVSADAQPVMWLTLTSDERSAIELSEYAEQSLADQLSVVSGVARVIVGGSRRKAMRVWLDVQAMAAADVTVGDVVNALRRENLELPAGRVESTQREFTVRTLTRMQTPEDFRELVIRASGNYQVTLDDIARVEIGPESTRTAVAVNGQTAVGLGVVRQSKSNTLAVASAVEARLDELRENLPRGVNLSVAYSEAVFIQGSIFEVLKTMAITAGLVVAVIFMALRSPRATLVPAATIPVSLIASFLVLWWLDFSINTLTLLALVLAIGLVVDDSIVVLENVYRRNEEGEPRLLAAVRGSSQVAFAVIATTLVLISVFVPLAFIPGDTGRLFTEFGIALAAAVSFSSLVALTLGAMLSSKLVGAERQKPHGRLFRTSEAALEGISRGYCRALKGVVDRPLLVVVVALVISLVAWFALQALPRELAPIEDRGAIIIPVEAPEGASMEYTQAMVDRIEAIVQRYGGDGPVDNVLSIVAAGREGAGAVNQAFLIVDMKHWEERDIPQQQLQAELFPQLLMLPGARAFAVNPPSLEQGGFEAPVQVAIGGPDYQTAARWGQMLLEQMEQMPLLVDTRLDYNQRQPQVQLRVDRRRAADLGIDARTIGEALGILFGGQDITDFIDDAEIYEVIVEAESGDADTPDDINNVFLRTSGERLVPLRSIVSLTEVGTPTELKRVDRSPSVTFNASLAPGIAYGDAIDSLEAIMAETLPPQARIRWIGQAENYQEAGSAVVFVMLMALLIVYLILAAQFESFLHPLVMMLSVPLAFTGGLFAIWIAGDSFNIFSQVGLVLLIGLVAKNGILLVDFANQIRDAGEDVRSAALRAGEVRLRPILMTSVATIFGALPLALATGPGAEGRTTIGITVIGGMLLSTLLTLFVVPTLYAAVAPYTKPGNYLAKKLAKEEREHRGR
ncbi:efflux RND transporter permease subunit [Thiohalomonas denitrificans]|uniref:efflux RND transporter permease subunit n=1 Tax=Thiohalomonas denitrificans TaxID=415747 RepID=UPI0026F32283|nr:efflux RND transporter permease subunit [Thiohalomonas denitrificans]